MKKFLYAGISIILFLTFIPLKSEAAGASLFLSPGSGSLRVGEQISVRVVLNTGGTAINAGEATISFPAAQLEVVRLAKGQIFSIWAEEPHYGNKDGTVRFAGGLPAPGYSGSSGTILTIVFRAKASGTAPINFLEAAVLADDGYGTNVLASVSGGRYDILTLTVPPPRPPPPAPPPARVEDTEPPDPFDIVVEPGRITTERSPKITFIVQDRMSGISHVLIELDGKEIARVPGTQIGFSLPELSPGAHEVAVVAFDKAGNERSQKVVITILAIPPPEIKMAPKVIHVGDYLGVSGIAPADSRVKVTFKQGQAQTDIIIFADPLGNWSALFPQTLRQAGPAYLIARIVDEEGLELSDTSAIWTFKIIAVPFLQIGPVFITSIYFLIVLILLFLIMAAIMLLFGKRLRRFITALRRETSLSLRSVRRELDKMHRDLEEHAAAVRRSKGGALDKKEAEFHHRLEGEIQELKKTVERTERVIDDYLKDNGK